MTLFKILSWLILFYGIVGIVIAFFTKQDERNRILLPYKRLAAIMGFFLVVILGLIVKIGAQDVGVVTTPTGVRDDELHTGWHILMPWNSVHKMDKTVWVYTCAASTKEGAKPNSDAIWAPTKDGIKMGFDVSVSWRIIPDQASWIYANVSENDGGNSGRYLWLEENVIRPKLKSTLALTVSSYTPIEAYSYKREEIQDQVYKRIAKELAQYKIKPDQVDIREVYYNKEYEKSINNKKLAEQEALRLVEVTKQKTEQLKQAEIEKNIAIQKAEGESKALQIKGQSISNNPKIIQLEWISKWDGKLPVTMLGESQGIIVNMNQ